MSSWTYSGWSQDDDENYGLPYITTNNSNPPTKPNFTNVATVWDFSYMLPTPSVPYINSINFDSVSMIFNVDKNKNFGMPCTGHHVVQPQGSFMNCSDLTSVTIPMSVDYISNYAFMGTSLTAVTIAPDCLYYCTSFPSGCVVSYYTAVSLSVTFGGESGITFSQGENYNIKIRSSADVEITLSNGGTALTRPCTHYEIADVDTSASLPSGTGKIYVKAGNQIVANVTFPYAVN